MTEKVDRYYFFRDPMTSKTDLHADPDGGWVRYSNYEALAARLVELEAENQRLWDALEQIATNVIPSDDAGVVARAALKETSDE